MNTETVTACAHCQAIGNVECYRIPTYADGTLVTEGDKIRYRQAPGGLMARSEKWTYGLAAYATTENWRSYGCVQELYLLAEDTRYYLIYAHEIERAEP